MSKINLDQPGCGWLDNFRAITSRMTRQREMVTSVNIDCFHIFEDAIQVFATLMQAQEVSFGDLSIGLVGGKIREILSEKSWQVVVAALQSNLVVGTAFIARQELAEARKETCLQLRIHGAWGLRVWASCKLTKPDMTGTRLRQDCCRFQT